MESKIATTNKFIEAVYKIDTREKKMLTAMINAVQSAGAKTKYSFSALELAQCAGIDTSSIYRDIKQIMDKLTDIKIRNIDDELEEFEFFRFVDQAGYKKGELKFKLSEQFKECIFKLEREFTKYLIKNIRPMKSVYSIRLYELLKQHENFGKRTFNINELKELLQTPNYDYNNFDRNILLKAQKEINEHSDIEIKYKPKRKGRSYATIEFLIKINPKNKEETEQDELPNIPDESNQKLKLDKELISNGVKLNIIKNLVKSQRLNWDWMYEYWKETLEEKSQHKQLRYRGKYIKECFDLSNTEEPDFFNWYMLRVSDDLRNM